MPEPTEIRTERLLLRPFRLTDADDVYACLCEGPRVGTLLAAPVAIRIQVR